MNPHLLLAANASEWTGPTGNNTWLLRGRVSTLIDAGVGAPDHLRALEAALGGSSLDQVLITHGHRDHASGVDALRRLWPRLGIRSWENGSLRDGLAIATGDAALEVLHTPGHAPDHCCFRDPRSGDIFSGDLARRGGTVVIPAGKGGNLRQYLAALERIRQLRPPRLLPGHGPIVDDPVALIDEYVRHRARRDSQILEALAAGRRTAEEIAASIYGTLSPSLQAAAGQTVLAHLIKLKDEGRVVEAPPGAWAQAG